MQVYKAQADLIKALAHPTRLQILEILAVEESCVCHLTAILSQRQPYVSQQLMTLRNAGLVLDRKDGVMVYYRLAAPCIATLITLTRQLVSEAEGSLAFPPVPRSPVSGCPCPKCQGVGCWN
ncbi:MAG: ArsR family transcriptional regulator [Chloroflexi bacterium HGW-Chloroflexi-1]|nr:MAG: ArsR family transcriptional regulator [Chloroflexi bacterium HGW-Chloroflexi-1]